MDFLFIFGMNNVKRELYPKNWEEISLAIRKRSDGRCECTGECGLHCRTNGVHRCWEMNGKKALFAKGKIVLTVAHLCHHPECSDEDHLKSMCNKCHLRFDSRMKMIKLRSKRIRESQQPLFSFNQ